MSAKSQLQTQISQTLRRKKRRRLPKLPKPLTTKFLERRYFGQLKGITDLLKRLTKQLLLPELENIVTEARELRPDSELSLLPLGEKVPVGRMRGIRSDRYVDKVELVMNQLRTQFLTVYPEAELRRMALKAMEEIEVFNLRQIDRNFRVAFGGDYSRFEPWLTDELRGFVKGNVSLMTSISEEYFTKVEGVVLRGAQSGRLAKNIAQDIQGQFGIAERRAAVIARDQVSSFNGNLTQLRQANAGIEKYRWQTSGDNRVRDEHESRDGKIFSWKDPPSDGHPGQAIMCRCVAIPVFE